MDRNVDGYGCTARLRGSLSARRAWIEIPKPAQIPHTGSVALRKESVDRNLDPLGQATVACVALRKESVDRNLPEKFAHTGHEMSLSARRAWIEIPAWQGDGSPPAVALRKESVDRNRTNTH